MGKTNNRRGKSRVTVALQWLYSGSTVGLQWVYSGSTQDTNYRFTKHYLNISDFLPLRIGFFGGTEALFTKKQSSFFH